MAKTEKSEIKASSKILSFFAYLLFFFGILPLILWAIKENDRFVRYHTEHAIILFYVWLGVNAITYPMKLLIPGFAGIRLLIGLAFVIIWISGLFYSLSGQQKAIIFGDKSLFKSSKK